MARIRSLAIHLILIFLILATQHVAAANDANSARPAMATESSYLSISNTTSGTGTSAGNELRRLFDLYKDARSAGILEEADVLAKQIVELSIQSFGFYSKNTAHALTNLGTLQTTNNENNAAIQNFAAAIEIIEQLEDRLSMDLINPLKAMGAAQLQAGYADRARIIWNRAVHISHVNLGPHNYEQIETLVSIARLSSGNEISREAKKLRKRIYYLQVRDANEGGKAIRPTP